MTMRSILATVLASAVWLAAGGGPSAASGDCSAAAAQVVAQTGGQLLSATPSNQGGQAVCKVTVLVPGAGNERPKKVTVTVPM
jgi:hypothetical protein